MIVIKVMMMIGLMIT